MHARLILAMCFMMLSSVPLYAYIDPGMGSYVVQLLIAGALAFGFLLKTQWRKVVSFFKNRRRGKGTTGNDT